MVLRLPHHGDNPKDEAVRREIEFAADICRFSTVIDLPVEAIIDPRDLAPWYVPVFVDELSDVIGDGDDMVVAQPRQQTVKPADEIAAQMMFVVMLCGDDRGLAAGKTGRYASKRVRLEQVSMDDLGTCAAKVPCQTVNDGEGR